MDTDAAADPIVGWKLLRLRRDGTLGPLFINTRQRLEVGVAYEAEDHPTPGYAHRPGWHVCSEMDAPHLSKRGRVWAMVEVEGVTTHHRPACQGGIWYTAQRMTIVCIEDPAAARMRELEEARQQL